MTKRERILAVLRGERPDRVPFTCKEPTLPRGEIELAVRNEGLAIVTDSPVVHIERPHVEVLRRRYQEGGIVLERETLQTPVGEVHQTWRPGAFGMVRMDHLIKGPDDYEVMAFIIKDEVYAPSYPSFLRAQELRGEDGFVFGGWMPPSPLMCMLWEWMGAEQFSVDMLTEPTRFFSMYDLLMERQIEQYRIAADSPALVIHGEENMTSSMIGLDRFKEYCVPVYDAFASILDEKGKMLALHMDGQMKGIADALAETKLHIVEAFCPVPDGDLAMAEARRIWRDKIIWINFPSPVHLRPPDEIEAHARQILRDVAPGDRFIMGITEDFPEHAWRTSLPVLSRVMAQEGALPLSG